MFKLRVLVMRLLAVLPLYIRVFTVIYLISFTANYDFLKLENYLLFILHLQTCVIHGTTQAGSNILFVFNIHFHAKFQNKCSSGNMTLAL